MNQKSNKDQPKRDDLRWQMLKEVMPILLIIIGGFAIALAAMLLLR